MKPYRDVFGNKITKRDVAMACQAVAVLNANTPVKLSRATRWGIGKAGRIMRVLEDAGVVHKTDKGTRSITLRNFEMAVNAANRQLKKGRS